MGVKTVGNEYGTDILTAIAQNDLAKLKAIFDKRLKSNSKKIRELCESEIQHKPTKTFACPLMLAVRLRDATILRYMLGHGVNPNFMYSRTAAGSSKVEVVTPLHVAVDLGHYDIVDALLATNADCNVRDHNSDCPLHVAVMKSDVAMARTLLVRGANVNGADRVGNTCTHTAARFGHYQMVATLIASGADINRRSQKDGALPIQVAAREGHWHCLKLFHTSDGAPVDSAFRCFDENREVTALHLAASGGHHETVKVLIDSLGASVNVTDSHGNTALHCLVLKPYKERRMRDRESFRLTAKCLIDRRVKVNARNGFGDTALHLAAMNNYLKVCELLLESGASIDIENKERLKPIDIIPQNDHVTRQLLRSHAAKKQQHILLGNRAETSTSAPKSSGQMTSSTRAVSQQQQQPLPLLNVPTVAPVPVVMNTQTVHPTVASCSQPGGAERQVVFSNQPNQYISGTGSSAMTKIITGSTEATNQTQADTMNDNCSQIKASKLGESKDSNQSATAGNDVIVTPSSSSASATLSCQPQQCRLHAPHGPCDFNGHCCHRPAANCNDDGRSRRYGNGAKEPTRRWGSIDSLDSEFQSTYTSSDRCHSHRRDTMLRESRIYASSDGGRRRRRVITSGNSYEDPYRRTDKFPVQYDVTSAGRRDHGEASEIANRRREEFQKQRSTSLSASETSRLTKHRRAEQQRALGRRDSDDQITVVTPLGSVTSNEIGFFGNAIPGLWPFYRNSGNYYDDVADMVADATVRTDCGDDSDFTDDATTTIASVDSSPMERRWEISSDAVAKGVKSKGNITPYHGVSRELVSSATLVDQLPTKLPKKSTLKSSPERPVATSSPGSSRALNMAGSRMRIEGLSPPAVEADVERTWDVQVPSTRSPNTIGIHCGTHNITISVDSAASSSGYGNNRKQKAAVEGVDRLQTLIDQSDEEKGIVVKKSASKTRKKSTRSNLNEKYDESRVPADLTMETESVATSLGTIDEPEVDQEVRAKKKASRSAMQSKRSVVEKQLDKYNYRHNELERRPKASLGDHSSVEV